MADNVASLFRGTAAHSPSMAALARESDGVGPIDFCIPCNPYFPTPGMFDELAGRLREIITYYPSSADTITAELCALLQLPPSCVAMGNGSTELITWIDHLLVRESLAIPVPTFGRWTDQPMETGKRVDMFPLMESNGFALDPAQYIEFIRARGTRVAVICNPNNPDGGFLTRRALVNFMDQLQDLDLIVIDESFLEFADAESDPSVVEEAVLRPNVIVLRSLGKNFGLHGIRFGYLVANPALAGKVRSMLPKWNLNSFAETVVFMLKEHGQEYMESLHMVRRDRLDMARQLSALPGLTVYPSQGNFLFVRLPVGAEGTVVRDRLLSEHRILVRECGNKIGSSSRFLRLVVRPETDVRRLVSGMEQVLYGSRRGAAVPELGTGTSYSSGTAAVDRLISETNGVGMPLAAQAAAMPSLPPAQTWPGPAPAQAPAGMPMMPPQQQPAARMPAPAPQQQPMPAVAQMPGVAQQMPGVAQMQPAAQMMPQAPQMSPVAQMAQMAQTAQAQAQAQRQQAPIPAVAQAPSPAAQAQARSMQPPPQPPAMPAMSPAPAAGLGQTGMPGLRNRGLTAAQVRGRTEPEPAPAPQPTGWPAAGAMYNQVG
ncbi:MULTISPECIES: histidinol-phosphate transaminase [unclassified Streptomyces]|uniref:pyridoxal phosphate-dependent aminotransferase n=1 Tax=unclassified Streptomyces TaxID=2593676 RepID=UPI00225354F6|nr:MULTISPECIES: histidinol-phosphate transaminase [unclassified Streptomyces]MCX4400967.1 histidinol-phosphate aminotransferase family protein [Streptomyces sp. NBC_01764]MCX5090052.1 histidinol-phosphate aminotransferase family protein [Streptomyces sp. NBC_00365]MCX5184414.1 histidinol-phosphate aminotransferase family protein [Streptomyces sp. NBC_00268]